VATPGTVLVFEWFDLFVGLVGAGVVLLPFYFISFMFKIGNLANDGYKLVTFLNGRSL
jgi:hypothetical protein